MVRGNSFFYTLASYRILTRHWLSNENIRSFVVGNGLGLFLFLVVQLFTAETQNSTLKSQACFCTLNPVLAFVACLTHELGQMGCARLPTFPWPVICTAMRLEPKDASLPDRQVPGDTGWSPKETDRATY